MSQTKPDSNGSATRRAEQNVEDIMRLEQREIHRRSPVEKIADKTTTAAGSTTSLITHVAWFGVWIALNTGLVPGIAPFDPFPFSFLTLVVSLEAIFLTLLVLMSQNRMTKEADKRAHLDLQVNMLAEQEATIILRKVQQIGQHLGLPEDDDSEAQELREMTNVHQLAETLDQQTNK